MPQRSGRVVGLSSAANTAAHEHRGPISIDGRWFKDQHGRTLLLRGANVAGITKLPARPPGDTHLFDRDSFFDHRHVSFVGRPFPKQEAMQHFLRLKSWGLTFLRFLVPWEALEHMGPGEYDWEYIHYLCDVLRVAEVLGFKVLIDPHQDTWSRYSGGSGAPGWTFEVAGMDITQFKATWAAVVHNTNLMNYYDFIWPTNYAKLACATMFTLFFGGDVFAPKLKAPNGEPIQQFLQNHYFAAYQTLAREFKNRDLQVVVAFDSMNEPHQGYIGNRDLMQFRWDEYLLYRETPSALQSMALGEGIAQTVEFYDKSWPYPTAKAGLRRLNVGKERAWLAGQPCIWRQHGIWDIRYNATTGETEAFLKSPLYFTRDSSGRLINFNQDFLLPFMKKYAAAIHEIDEKYLIFVEGLPSEKPPFFSPQDHIKNLVYAPHWYDLKTVFERWFSQWVTFDVLSMKNGARKNFRGQISHIISQGYANIGNVPIFVGESGIPFNMTDDDTFEGGDYSRQRHALDAICNGFESSLVGFTLWNYNSVNDHRYGDHWNREDFSIFCSEEFRAKQGQGSLEGERSMEVPTAQNIQTLCDGGRALGAIVRPYASKTVGIPVKSSFDMHTRTYHYEFDSQGKTCAEGIYTEIFVPNLHYRTGIIVDISDGVYDYDVTRQSLYYKHHSPHGRHRIKISPSSVQGPHYYCSVQ